MTETNKFDMDKFKPNPAFLILFIASYLAFITLTDSYVSVILGSMSVLLLGWMIVFGKYKD